MITNPLSVFGVLSLIVFVMIWLERFPHFRKLGAAAGSIILAMILSNTGVIPGDSPVYGFFTGYGVLAGTALVLLSADLSSVRAAGSTMLKIFFVGAFGSVVGAMTMGFILHPSLGEDAHKLAGQFAATYIGGGVNFAAVGQAFGTSSEIFTAGVAADVIITAFWLVTCLAAPLFLGAGRAGSKPEAQADAAGPDGAPADGSERAGAGRGLAKTLYSSGKPVSLRDLGAIVAIAVASIWASSLLTGLMPQVPVVFWLTTIILILAQLPFAKNLTGATVIGHYFLLLFLACNGARSVVQKIVEVGPEVFYFAVGTVTIHGLVIFGIGRLMKIDISAIVVASQANIGGSTSAMAIATARGYEDRILPGVAVGLVGIAIGNYVGLAVGNLMKILL